MLQLGNVVYVLTRACTGRPMTGMYTQSPLWTSLHCFDKESVVSSPTEDPVLPDFSPCTCIHRKLAQGTTLSKPNAHAGWILWLLHPSTGEVRRGRGRLLQQLHQLGNSLWKYSTNTGETKTTVRLLSCLRYIFIGHFLTGAPVAIVCLPLSWRPQ